MSKSRSALFFLQALILGVFVLGSSARASTYSLTLSGNVTSVDPVLVGAPFSVGDTMSIRIIYNDAGSDDFPLDPLVGQTSAIFYSVSIGSYVASSTIGKFFVRNNVPSSGVFDELGGFSTSLVGPIFGSGFSAYSSSYELKDFDEIALNSDSFFIAAALLSYFDTRQLRVDFRNSLIANLIVRGDIQTLSLEPVPIPAALPLLAAGLGAMGLMGWRRKRKTVLVV